MHEPLKSPVQAAPANEVDQAEDDAGQPVAQRFFLFQVLPGWMTSFLIHLLLIILLALFTFDIPQQILVSLEAGQGGEEVIPFDELEFDTADVGAELMANTPTEIPATTELSDVAMDVDINVEPETDRAMTELLESFDAQATGAADAGAMDSLLAGAASNLSGRSEGQRRGLGLRRGASEESINSVALALKWLADHQLPDGSWSYDHRTGPGSHRTSPNPGDFENAPNSATALALLTFLGAGQTHFEGEYTSTVERGLAYLIANAQQTRHGWSWEENQGLMYAHGLVAITLCEAYAMTDDQRLDEPAREALRYIEYAQDPRGGGWRYTPREPGDLSVTGFQVMALKSAKMCGLELGDDVIRNTRRFLNYVSSESGAFYGYVLADPNERRPTMTSVGLLCQMYLGWTRDNPALKTGVQWLAERGPDIGNWKPGMVIAEDDKDEFRAGMYYNYYATQVFSHYGGPEWETWNASMRDFLVATQCTEGDARGSWFFQDQDEGGYVHGGRLYATTLAAMTLEVYWRYLPLYDEKLTSEAEFPLD
jgi:hypothetical protein